MSAFEADRFNRSRTSPENSQHSVVSTQQNLTRPADTKNLPQNLRTLTRQHAAADFHSVFRLGWFSTCTTEVTAPASDRPSHKPNAEFGREPALRAHRSRLNCSKQFTVAPTMNIGFSCRVILRNS
jgi:hypothetical protein